MSQTQKDAPNPDQLARLLASTLLHKAARKFDLDTEGGLHDPVVWSARMRYFDGFGLRVVAERTLCGLLRVRDLETDEILVQSKPFDFTAIDTDAPMVEEAMKAWSAKRERERRDPIVSVSSRGDGAHPVGQA